MEVYQLPLHVLSSMEIFPLNHSFVRTEDVDDHVAKFHYNRMNGIKIHWRRIQLEHPLIYQHTHIYIERRYIYMNERSTE